MYKIFLYTITLVLMTACGGTQIQPEEERLSDIQPSPEESISVQKPRTNQPPAATTQPHTQAYLYETYQYQPNASDPDHDRLIYTIQNKPDWATFDTDSGLLSGIPTTEGNFTDIQITISDANHTTTLPPFSIEVQKARNIAHLYATATQPPKNDYPYYQPPQNAIDANLSTNNHTQCSDPDNWLQIALPDHTIVRKIVIHNVPGQQYRLEGTGLYMGFDDYNGTPNPQDFVQKLNADMTQTVTFETPRETHYLLFKNKTGSDNACLHLREVEVYGTTPVTPVFRTEESSFLISAATLSDSFIADIDVIDFQQDDLSYRIIGDVPFAIDAGGKLTTTQKLKPATRYSFEIVVSDGINSVTRTFTVETTADNAVGQLLQSGDILQSQVTEEELHEAILDALNKESFVAQIYRDAGAFYLAPGHYSSQLIEPKRYRLRETYYTLLTGEKGHIFAIAGEEKSRFAVYAFNPIPLFSDAAQRAYEPYMQRVISWLIYGTPDMPADGSQVRIALAFVNQEEQTRSWLQDHYDADIRTCNDAQNLITCLEGIDLLIAGNNSNDPQAADALRSYLDTGAAPLLYLHPNWGENDLSKMLEGYYGFSFPYGGNWWADDRVATEVPSEIFAQENAYIGIDTIRQLIQRFQNSDFNFDWSKCYKKDADGNKIYDASYEACEEVPMLQEGFWDGANWIKTAIHEIETDKQNIFAGDAYRLWKLLILLGDLYRQHVDFPMDKLTSDPVDYFRSLYADSTAYNYRTVNPVQPDMGNFSRSSVAHIAGETFTRTLTGKTPFRSAGLYLLPGKTATITRTDHNQNVATHLFVNSLRDAATHLYRKEGYNRPKYLQSIHYPIAPAESIQITSAYGGPLFIAFDTNDQNVSFRFENVAQHPVWAYWMDDTQKAAFQTALDAGIFDWAEIITPNFELHSRLDKMRTSISDPKYGNDLDTFIGAINHYTSNYPYALAGFRGDGITPIAEAASFAQAHNLSIPTSNFVKHMNADQAACGTGCSGNPYDADWAFDPVSHGDLHEIGHGLEKGLFRFEGWNYHASTNPYSYYTKSIFNQDHEAENILTTCQNLPFQELYQLLHESLDAADRTDYLQTNLWQNSGWSEQVLFEIQAMMLTQYMGTLQNGWHLLTRLHLLEHAIAEAKKDWENKKHDIGFDNYTLDAFTAITHNDWLLISYSFAGEIDFRPFFDMYAIPYSKQASDQVAQFGYEKAPERFFVSTPDGYCRKDAYGDYLNKASINLTEAFPY